MRALLYREEGYALTRLALTAFARLVACSDWQNQTEYGRAVLNFGNADVKRERTECLPTIRPEDEA